MTTNSIVNRSENWLQAVQPGGQGPLQGVGALMNAQLQPKKPRVMESLGFLIGSIAVGVTIAIVMLVHAVHGNGGLPVGFSGWNRLRDHRAQRWPDLGRPGHPARRIRLGG